MARQNYSKSSKSQSRIHKSIKNKKQAFVGKRPQITVIPGTLKHVAGQSTPPSNFKSATVFQDGFDSAGISSDINVDVNRFSSSSANTYSSNNSKFVASSPNGMYDIPLNEVNELRYCAPCDFRKLRKVRDHTKNSDGEPDSTSNPNPKSFTRWIVLLWKQFSLKIRGVFIRGRVSRRLPDGFQFVKPHVEHGAGVKVESIKAKGHESSYSSIYNRDNNMNVASLVPQLSRISESLTVPEPALNPLTLTHSRSRSALDIRTGFNTPEPRAKPKREARYYGNGYGNEDRRWTWGFQYADRAARSDCVHGYGDGYGIQTESLC